MSYNKKQGRNEQKRVARRRYDEHVLKNVVSLRVSDEELEMLSRISKNNDKSISEIMREAIKCWYSDRGRLCMDM